MNHHQFSLPDRMKAAGHMLWRAGCNQNHGSPLPVLKPGMVLVRVEAARLTPAMREQGFAGGTAHENPDAAGAWLRKPRQPILGTVYAGTVAAVEQGVTAFKPGDRVRRHPRHALGCHAQYVAVPQGSAIALMPDGDAADMASLVFGGATALFFLEKAGLPPEKALIYGPPAR